MSILTIPIYRNTDLVSVEHSCHKAVNSTYFIVRRAKTRKRKAQLDAYSLVCEATVLTFWTQEN